MIRFDILTAYINQGWKVEARNHSGVRDPRFPGVDYHLHGEIGEWLKQHGHSATFTYDLADLTYYMDFEDHKTAMLFKLTWL